MRGFLQCSTKERTWKDYEDKAGFSESFSRGFSSLHPAGYFSSGVRIVLISVTGFLDFGKRLFSMEKPGVFLTEAIPEPR